MAALGSQTIAASYEQLLHVDTDGGGDTTTLVPIKDGDNDTTFCLQLATTSALIVDDAKLYFGTGSDAYIEYDEDGTDTWDFSPPAGGMKILDDKKLVFGTDSDASFEYDEDGTNTLLYAGASLRISDDVKLEFGSGGDASIEYDEDGADNLSIAGADVSIANGIGLIVGNTAQVAMGEVTAEAQILGTTETDACLAIGLASTTDALSPSLKFVKGAHATIGNHSVTVADNEELGKIQAYGSDATDSDTLSSEIAFNIDDDGVGTGTLGGEILLKTSGKDGTLDTAVTIDSSQNVVFEKNVTVGNGASGETIFKVLGGEAGNAEIDIFPDEADDDADKWKIVADISGNFGISTKSTGSYVAAMTIDSSTDVTLTGDLIMADGKGIDFAADASPSAGMTAEILDDYEEGTWTGVVSDGTNPMTMHGSYTTGYYTKVGNLVTVSGIFITSSLGSATGNIRITGLPFTVSNNNEAYSGGAAAYGVGLAITAGHSVGYYGVINDTWIWLGVWDATTGVTAMQASEWTADGTIIIGFSYRAA